MSIDIKQMIGTTTTDPKQKSLYHLLAALSLLINDNVHEHWIFLFPVESFWKKNVHVINRQKLTKLLVSQ